MLRFISKSLTRGRSLCAKTSASSGGSSTPFVRTWVSSLNSHPNTKGPQSLTVSYLTNSCGVGGEKAISASKLVKTKSSKRADSVLKLLRANGFTELHIRRLVFKFPFLLLVDAEKTLKPKIEFFKSLGFKGSDLLGTLFRDGVILASSLNNRIIPAVELLRGIFETNENVVAAIRRYPNLVRCRAENVSILRAHGMPEKVIGRLIMARPMCIMVKADLFREMVAQVKGMGFDPVRWSFVEALCCLVILSKSKWERKRKLLMSFGWSENGFKSAFIRQPAMMLVSEKKIGTLMDFYLNRLGLDPYDIAICPNILMRNLDRTIIPRCSVLKVLMSEGLIRKKVNIVSMLNLSKKRFEIKYVTCFQEYSSEVIKAYRGEIVFQGLGN